MEAKKDRIIADLASIGFIIADSGIENNKIVIKVKEVKRDDKKE